jgi:membrane protein
MFKWIKSSIVYKYIEQLIFRYKYDELASMSAQITYYLILAFFPFLVFLINLLSFTPFSNRLLFANFYKLLPHDTAALVNEMLVHFVQAKSTTFLFLGMFASLWAASQGMSAIIRGLNHSYDVKENRNYIKRNLISLISTIGVSVMIIFSLFMIVFGRIIGSYVFDLIGEKTLFTIIWPFFRYGISLTFMLFTFYLVYKYLPNRPLKSNNIIIGTIFATFGWVSASLLFAYYVNYFANYEQAYGSIGGIFALIIWLYISTLIILLGGELNAISSRFENKEK